MKKLIKVSIAYLFLLGLNSMVEAMPPKSDEEVSDMPQKRSHNQGCKDYIPGDRHVFRGSNSEIDIVDFWRIPKTKESFRNKLVSVFPTVARILRVIPK